VKQAGDRAEDLALAHLSGSGLRLLARNYRSRFGEIDLILDDRGTLVFVEVRSRSHRGFGGAAESITAAKRARIIATARNYLARSRRDSPCRFDAVLIDANDAVEWIRGAFTA
jgi:putative endonuclease